MPRSLLKVTVLALSAIWTYQVAAKALTHAQLGQATNDQTTRQGIDIFHDPLPPGALARLGTIRLRVPLENGIYSLAFSSDGKFLASGEGKGRIDLWEVPSGKLIRQWRPHESIVMIAFSADGKYLASAGGKHVYIWEATKETELRDFEVEVPLSGSVAFSPDGLKLAFAALDGSVRLCAVDSGKEIIRFQTHGLDGETSAWGSRALVFSQDGHMLAFATGKKTTLLYDLKIGKQIHSFQGGVHAIISTAFSPDGKILATGERELEAISRGKEIAIRLWDTETGKLLRLLKGHGRGGVHWLQFIDGGTTLLSAGGDGSVRWWETATGKQLRKSSYLAGSSPCAALSPDERTLALGQDSSIELLNLAKSEPDRSLVGHQYPALFAQFSSDGKTITSAGADRSCRIWNAFSGKQIKSFTVDDQYFGPLALSRDCQTLASRSWPDSNIRFWEAETGKRRSLLEIPGGNLAARAAFSGDSKMLAVGHQDCAVSVWDLQTQKELRRFPLFAIDLERRKKQGRQARTRPWNNISFLAFSPHGHLLAAADNWETFVVWNIATGRELRRFTSPLIRPVALSADWKTVATGETGIVLREMISWQDRARIKAPQVNFDCAAFSPDGQILAATVYSYINHTSCITLWDVFSGKEIRQLSGFQGGIGQLFFSPDGNKLASVGTDTTILIWDVSGTKSKYASADLSADWNDLRGEGTKAWQALGRLIGEGRSTVSFLKDHLQPAEMPKGKNIDQLVKDLDDAAYSVREEATSDLEKLEALAQPQLEKALASKPSAELKKRAEMLLSKVTGPVTSPEKLQVLRAIEVLEHIATPEAQEVLKTLAQGAPEARLTHEAKASLERLAKRAQAKP